MRGKSKTAVPQEKLFWTVEEYLEFEKTPEVQHEYVDGVIYPVNFDFQGMAGESKRHNLISGELYAALLFHLRGGNCRVFLKPSNYTRVLLNIIIPTWL